MKLQDLVTTGPEPGRRPWPWGTVLAAMVVGVVAMLILPLPTPLLDILITCNISLALLILLVSMRSRGAAGFSTLPTLLLLTTLFRLGLNVSSTRLILLQADAGQVIASFGGFVVGGSLVVGAVIFLILTVIQYLVIARGSERVAEVAARFTLDALPGKQLAIDADVRAGLLDRAAAGRRRRELERECQVYGAMDGAMKFVRGDAIAAILITLIDICGGLLIGVFSRGMSIQEAASVYARLTVGDGLVSQIPALLISLSAGVVVTRVATAEGSGDEHLGRQLGRQLLSHPRSLALAGIVLLLLALVPGLPAIPFAIIGAGALALAALLSRRRLPAHRGGDVEAGSDGWARRPPPVVELELGGSLTQCAQPATGQGRQLSKLLRWTERLLWEELGLPLPRVVVSNAATDLAPDSFRILMRGVPAGQGEIRAARVIALAPRAALEHAGARSEDLEEASPPGVAPPAWYVATESAVALRAAGIQLIEPPALLALHLADSLRRRAPELLGIQETQDLVDALAQTRPALVQEVLPRRLGLPGLAALLGELVAEEVSVRDLGLILEAVAALPGETPAPPELTEHVRRCLGRAISSRLADPEGNLRALRLDPVVEEVLEDEASADGDLSPDLTRDLVEAVKRALPPPGPELPPVLLTAPGARRQLRRALQPHLPSLPVLSYRELSPDLKVQTLAQVSLV